MSMESFYEYGSRAGVWRLLDLSIGLHCRLVGRPGRFASLTRFLDYALKHDQAWVCWRVDIARHWHT